MLEKIKNQINKIEFILTGIKELNESIEEELKQNKYSKEITDKYFFNQNEIIKKIKQDKELIKELKENHIKLTDSQKELEKKYNNFIDELTKSLNSTLKLLKKLEQEKTYIDDEIIDILKLNEIDELKDIIQFNKTITLKKKGYIKEQQIQKEQNKIEKKVIKIESKEKEEKKQETKKTINNENKEETNEKNQLQEPEKVLMFKDKKEIDEYLKKEYNIEIETDKNIEELNDMIEIIENSSMKELNQSLLKEILEKSYPNRLKRIKEILEENDFEAKEIAHLENFFEKPGKIQTINEFIICYKHVPKEQKIVYLNKSDSRKEKIVRNKNALLTYGLVIKDTNKLLKDISIEKLDQIIEVGHYSELDYVSTLFNSGISYTKNIQLEDYLAQTRYENLYDYFFGGTIYYLTLSLDESKYDITDFRKEIYKHLEKDKKYKSKFLIGKPTLPQLTSKNEILRKQEEISKASFDNFLFTIVPSCVRSCPIFLENNIYFQMIEEKFSKGFVYKIDVDKSIAKTGFILISRPKVVRLLNEHVCENNEITKEIIKECMLYNLITTDEILNELDKILTEQFDLLDQKIKKY